MKKGLQCLVAIIVLFWGMPSYSGTTTDVLNAVSPSLVMIQADNTNNNIRNKGGGVVVDADLVATNCHVIEDADEIWVTYKGKEYTAKAQYTDWDRDVCALRVRGINAQAAVRGNTNSLKAGSRIYAIKTRANPQPIPLAEGVILAIRSVDGGKFLQISTPVLPGSSGGGLFDQEGRLIGLMSYYLDIGDRQLYYAVPVEWINALPGRQQKMSKASEINLHDLLKKSVELEEKEDWNGLLKHSLLWTELQPREYAAWFNLGIAYNSLGQRNQVKKVYKVLKKLDPSTAKEFKRLFLGL